MDESGTYFRDIYRDLLRHSPEFPSNDQSPNLRECLENTTNFVRAEMLARRHGLPPNIITHLREMALLQFTVDYKNATGLRKLVEEFGLAPHEVSRIVELIQLEKTYPCVSISNTTEMAIDENWSQMWKKEYAPIVSQILARPSVPSRFIIWLKQLLGLH